MTAFFETGAGRDLFGPYQPLALTTARTLEARMESTFAAMFAPGNAGPKLQLARGATTAFAQAYPIESLSFRREPLTGHPNLLVPDETKGLGGLATNVEQDLLTTQRIFTAYLEFLPSIARWEAELLLEEAGLTGIVVDSLSQLKEMQALLRDATTTRIPGEITRTLTALREERQGAMADVEVMRRDTLERLDVERNALSAEIDRQRVATLAQVRDEWKSAVQDLRSAARDGTSLFLSGLRKVAATLLTVLLLVALCSGVALACRRLTQASPDSR
jgi:hypothetical protein